MLFIYYKNIYNMNIIVLTRADSIFRSGSYELYLFANSSWLHCGTLHATAACFISYDGLGDRELTPHVQALRLHSDYGFLFEH